MPADRRQTAANFPGRDPPCGEGARCGVPVVGLIGGIGSGKSRVAAAFAGRGARVISGDELGHEALRQPEIQGRVVARWGKDLLDEQGEIQRRRLGAIVFNNPAELQALEAIVHPWITARIEELVREALADPAVPLVVLDAAVLLEAGWGHVCDRLVFVESPLEDRVKRVTAQRGWSAGELAAREAAQLTLTEKRSRADHRVDNSATPDALEREVDRLLREWRCAVHAPARPSGPAGASRPAKQEPGPNPSH